MQKHSPEKLPRWQRRRRFWASVVALLLALILTLSVALPFFTLF